MIVLHNTDDISVILGAAVVILICVSWIAHKVLQGE